MKQAGRLFVQLRRTTSEVKGTFDQVIRDAESDLRNEEMGIMKQVSEIAKLAKLDPMNSDQLTTESSDGNTDPMAPNVSASPSDSYSTQNPLDVQPSFDSQDIATQDGEIPNSEKE